LFSVGLVFDSDGAGVGVGVGSVPGLGFVLSGIGYPARVNALLMIANKPVIRATQFMDWFLPKAMNSERCHATNCRHKTNHFIFHLSFPSLKEIVVETLSREANQATDGEAITLFAH
jgi:ABC-type microcin C transport system permease subunit YejB